MSLPTSLHHLNHHCRMSTGDDQEQRENKFPSLQEPVEYLGHKLEVDSNTKSMLTGKCPICLEEYFRKSVVKLYCGHILDRDCFVLNENKNSKGQCPYRCEKTSDSPENIDISCLESKLNASMRTCANKDCYYIWFGIDEDKSMTCPYPLSGLSNVPGQELNRAKFFQNHINQIILFVHRSLSSMGLKPGPFAGWLIHFQTRCVINIYKQGK